MFTYDEYNKLIADNQKDKDGNIIYLYATNKEEQYSYIDSAKQKGYSVLLFDGELDVPCVSMFEQKFDKCRFSRVDADTIDRLIPKEDQHATTLTKEDTDNLSQVFKTQLPKLDKTEFQVEVQPLGEGAMPIVITQSEYMRRMKEMSRYQAGMSFYGEMPDSYSLVLNSDHPLVKQVLDASTTATEEQLKPIVSELKGLKAREQVLQQSQKDKKWEDITQQEKDDMKDTREKIKAEEDKRNEVIATYAKDNKVVHQLIDLALLQNGMLKGAALNDFLKRSIDLIK